MAHMKRKFYMYSVVLQNFAQSHFQFNPTLCFRVLSRHSEQSYKGWWLKPPCMKWDNPSRPTYIITCHRQEKQPDISNMLSSAVVIPLVLLWEAWYYHNAICHLSEGDRKAQALAIHSQLHTIALVIK